jgi:hypothetical protein
MKFQKIVGFGDSWMYGDELLDPTLLSTATPFWDSKNNNYRESNCFLGLLGKHYKVPVENRGISGGSLQSTIWSYLNWIQQDKSFQNCLVIVWLTESDRNSFYNPDNYYPWQFWITGRDQYIHSTWVDSNNPRVPEKFVNFVKQFQVLSNCDELSKLNYQQAVLFFDGQAARHNMTLLQFNGAAAPCHLSVPTLIDPEFDWVTNFRDRLDNQKRELVMSGDHPNEIGHRLISEQLISHIERVIIQ